MPALKYLDTTYNYSNPADTNLKYLKKVVDPDGTIRTEWAAPTDDAEFYDAMGNFSTPELVRIYGVEWAGDATNTKWVRTDKSANFENPVVSVAGSEGHSPFDNLMPWKGMVRETRSDKEMVKIPKFWYNLQEFGDGGLKLQIADHPVEGFVTSPTHMDRGDGKGERDAVYVGRYHCSGSNGCGCVTGVEPKNVFSRAQFRSHIRSVLGAPFYMWDYASLVTIQFLYLVEFANWNSQSTIGFGCGDRTNVGNMGYTDDMPYCTGTNIENRAMGLGTQYRYLEGLWDNVFDFIDGCYNNKNGMFVILNPAYFSDGSNGKLVGYPACVGTNSVSKYAAIKFSVSDSGGFPTFYPSVGADAGERDSATRDYWQFTTTCTALYTGGYYHSGNSAGLFNMGCEQWDFAHQWYGSRLMELPDPA